MMSCTQNVTRTMMKLAAGSAGYARRIPRMSLHHEYGLSDNDLRTVDQPTREKILSGYAKIKGLQLIQAGQIMNRDSRRLHKKALATYKNLGLTMPDDPDEEIVLGDKHTHVEKGVGAMLAAAAIGAMGAGGLGLAGLAAWWLLNREPDTPSTPPDKETIVNILPGFGDPDNVKRGDE